MEKQLLTVEFRYLDKPAQRSEHRTQIITVGIYDTIEQAVIEGNKIIDMLSQHFEVRTEDKFKVKGLWGLPEKLVTNTCYPTNRIEYFAKITTLKFDDINNVIQETFKAAKRYEAYRKEIKY